MQVFFRMSSVILLSAVSMPAMAQASASQGQDQVEEAAKSDHLEDIVVTAQRRSENLQRVPISITAVTGENLVKAGITDTQALAIVTPGLQLNSVRSAVVPFLRGIGTVNITPGDEGATAVYVDGILNPVATANVFALNNVERVEVLRGPQGTLFGRNTVGGLINVITKDPSETFGMNAEVGYGNYNTVFGSAYVTGGLAPGVAADVAVYGTHQGDGWGRNLNLGTDANFNREFALRSKLAVDLGTNTTAIFSADYSHGESDIGSSRQPLPGAISTGGLLAVGSIYDNAGEVPPRGRKEQYGFSLNLSHDFGSATLRSITAYRHYNVESNLDADGTPLKVFDIRDTQVANTFQQELLLTGSLSNLDYTVGLFYYHSAAGYHPITFASTVRATNNLIIDDEMKTNSFAAFAQGTYSITPSTRITAGLRYTRDERKIDGTITSQAGFPTPPGPGVLLSSTATLPASVTNRHFERLTWRGVIDQELGSGIFAYFSASRGFKSGVFSTTTPTAPAVQPETVDAYEVGLKADLFDKRLRLNVSAFKYNYKNIQVTSIGATGSPILLNAAAGKFRGVDGEIIYIAPVSIGSLQFRANFSVLDAKYSSFPSALFYNPAPGGGNSSSFGDASGNAAVQAPKFASSISVDYSVPVGVLGNLGLTATWAHNDGFFWDAQNRVSEPSFDVVNGEISLTSVDETWRIRLFGKNIFDKKRYIFVSIGANGDTGAAASPRTYGVAISRKF
ncbi:iron complex outermembrane receptor protein [Novosphingobium hassiacum]|uniref:Iron complex outermembrane receptor protein n=1 Tax=Novosphingobium hassiacum TaxID=173676 RepID=A0A7W6A0H8_9SPHN|nr:TonB-dependent receptor [Novosphingobium hassiacum]MBB3862886.1 iron complex outermembrane receptor protein [Novosphingobium hassiacum]